MDEFTQASLDIANAWLDPEARMCVCQCGYVVYNTATDTVHVCNGSFRLSRASAIYIYIYVIF